MLKQFACIGALAYAAQAASIPPAAPRAGIVRQTDQTLRPVYGLPANLINGAALPLTHGVLAASFSDQAGIILAPGAIELIGIDGSLLGSYSTPELHPVLNISGGPETAIAWLPAEGKLIRWTGSDFTDAGLGRFNLPGSIVAAQVTKPAEIDLWMEVQTGTLQHFRCALPSGAVTPLEVVPGVDSMAIVSGAALVFRDAAGLEVQTGPAHTQTLPISSTGLAAENASSHWLHIYSTSTGRQWLLNLHGPVATLSELPAIARFPHHTEAAQ